jgi:23S rRNA pseudouridine1911/1915/1917 synthase
MSARDRTSTDEQIRRRRPRPVPSLEPRVLLEVPGVLVVDKPAGVPTQPGRGHADDTLLNGAFALRGDALATLGPERDWGLVHRLDRDVSGPVALATTAEAYDRLRAAFAGRHVRKTYLALVLAAPPSPEGECSRPIREEVRGRMKVGLCPQRGGETALTRWRTLARNDGRTLLEVEPVTGRLHQIRVHMAALGCPVVGDRVYRVDAPPNTSPLPPGRRPDPLLLHAWRLEIPWPEAPGGHLMATSPVPAEMPELAAATARLGPGHG